MTLRIFGAIALVAGLFAVGGAYAQQQPAAPAAPPNLDAVPDKMPFATPYGTPITMERAQVLIQAAVAEANKRGWAMNVAVVDANGDLVSFARMSGAQLASIDISQHKARVAARYRRPTHALEDGVQKAGFNYLLTLDNVIASRGGIPLIEGGKLIGAIGCSSGPARKTRLFATPRPIPSMRWHQNRQQSLLLLRQRYGNFARAAANAALGCVMEWFIGDGTHERVLDAI